jgi:type IV secretion system protein VirB3
VRQSLLRPLLLLGCERELIIMSGMLAAMLVFAMSNLVLAVLGVGFWLLSLVALQRMAKADSQLSRTYIRHVNKKIYYPAQPHVGALEPEPKKHQ